MASSSNWERPSKRSRITPDGYENFERAHDFCAFEDILTFHVFPKLGWESEVNVEESCKRWRLWCKDNQKAAHDNATLGEVPAMKLAINDILYNEDKDLIAWLAGDISAYCDGFPL